MILNFIQAQGAIANAKDHKGLAEAMRSVRAPAYWPKFTPEQQKELCDLAADKNRTLSAQARDAVAKSEAEFKELIGKMANPNSIFF